MSADSSKKIIMKKYIFKKIIFLVTILLILGGLGRFLLTMENGLRFSFLVASKMIPGKLQAQKITGCLLSPIAIEGLYFENKASSVFVNKIYIDWSIKKLLLGEIDIAAIHVDTIKITTKVAAVAANAHKLTLKDVTKFLKKFSLPINFKLADLQIYNLSWQQGTSPPLAITNVILQSYIVDRNLVFLKGELKAKDAVMVFHGEVQKKWDISWKLHLSNMQKFFQKLDGVLDCEGKIYGERYAPEINTNVKLLHFKYLNMMFAKLQGKFFVDLSAKKTSWFDLNINLPKINSINFNQLVFSGHASPIKKSEIVFNMNLGAFVAAFPNNRHLKLEKMDVNGIFSQQGLCAQSNFVIAQQKPINIELKLPKLKNLVALFEEQPVYGQVMWETKNLKFLQLILPDIKNISGRLSLKYTMNGTLQHPDVIGEANLTNAELNIPELNIRLHDGALKIQNTHNKIEYKGRMHSGRGVLNLFGKTLFSQDALKSDVFINTKGFLVANTNEYKVIADSQLLLQMKDGFLDLTGKIFVPEANIKPGYLTYSDLLPAEIVYVRKETDKKSKEPNLRTNIQLNLGNKVYIDASGLKGNVQGQLQLKDEPQKATTAFGALYIRDGVYDFYRQQLHLTKGDLRFLGGAVTNPEVDVVAVRDIFSAGLENKLTVGVKMHGLLESVKAELFSDPNGLSKSDILSYLIIGKPSAQALGNKAQLLLQAASSANFGGAGEMSSLIDSFKNKLGFTEFGLTEETRKPNSNVKSNGVASITAFALGRFLTPKIYIGYSMGILDSVNVFRVKYYINKHWSLQSESSSLSNGADIFYTIESD